MPQFVGASNGKIRKDGELDVQWTSSTDPVAVDGARSARQMRNTAERCYESERGAGIVIRGRAAMRGGRRSVIACGCRSGAALGPFPVVREQDVDEQQHHPNADRTVRDIERRPWIEHLPGQEGQINLDEVDHMPEQRPVDQVADRATEDW